MSLTMDPEEKYPRLPITGAGMHYLRIDELPPDVTVCKDGEAAAHIIKKDRLSGKPIASGKAICRRETANEMVNRVAISNTCKDCLEQMDMMMSMYLYDDDNEEWYRAGQIN